MKLKTVDPKIDLGNDRNLASLSKQIEQLHTKLTDYNTTLSKLDATKLEIDEMERCMGDLLDQLMNGVSAKYGNDSREYEMAGGTRKSDRIRKAAESRARGTARKLVNAGNH